MTRDHRKQKPDGSLSRPRVPGWFSPQLLRDPVVLFWVGSYLVFFAIALATPQTILDDYPDARCFADFMAAIVPQIDLVTRVSGPAAQANRFVYSLLWAVIPVYTIIAVVQLRRSVLRDGFARQPRSWFGFALGLTVCLYAFVDGLFFMWEVVPGSRPTMRVFVDPVGRAFWAPLWAFAPLLCLVVAIFYVWGAFTGRFRPRARNQPANTRCEES